MWMKVGWFYYSIVIRGEVGVVWNCRNYVWINVYVFYLIYGLG